MDIIRRKKRGLGVRVRRENKSWSRKKEYENKKERKSGEEKRSRIVGGIKEN